MRKTLLILPTLLLFSLAPAGAQILKWGLNIAPGISYRLAEQASDNIPAFSIQSGEEAMYVFDFGVDLRKAIAPRIRFGTGIFYSQKGFSNTHVAAIYDDPGIGRHYLIDFVQDYLEVPFFLSYDVTQQDQLALYTLGGITNSLLLKSKNSVSATGREVNEETVLRLQEPYLKNRRLHNLGFVAGVGIRTDVDAKTALGIEALGRYMTSPLLDQVSNTRRRMYSLNVNFRFIRKIR